MFQQGVPEDLRHRLGVPVRGAEGFGQHIPKGYIYTAMAFSLFVEFLNIRSRKAAEPPVELRTPYAVGDGSGVPLPEDIHRPGTPSVPFTRPGA